VSNHGHIHTHRLQILQGWTIRTGRWYKSTETLDRATARNIGNVKFACIRDKKKRIPHFSFTEGHWQWLSVASINIYSAVHPSYVDQAAVQEVPTRMDSSLMVLLIDRIERDIWLTSVDYAINQRAFSQTGCRNLASFLSLSPSAQISQAAGYFHTKWNWQVKHTTIGLILLLSKKTGGRSNQLDRTLPSPTVPQATPMMSVVRI
jgi:hypothetical protein